MNISLHADPESANNMLRRLHETRDAFDSVAADYDGPRGNNALIQDMRSEMWRTLDATFPTGSRLMDLGCGTGLDAVRMARCGHHVTATDWSQRMVERTRERAEREQVAGRVQAITVGAHELSRVDGAGHFDGAYSNLGALNCVPDLAEMAEQCARLLKPRAALVFSVIGRVCPWEIGYYALQRNWRRVRVRFVPAMVPVGMNKRVVWTRYYTPREFYRPFERRFALEHFRGLCVLAPPPYLTGMKARYRRWYERLWGLERRAAGWPVLRNMGDHFVIVMTKR
ncbi:MAG: class I SAM-dependent methyltransferase [Steroidobacteraceae bacterium]